MRLAFCLFKYFPYGGLQRDFLRIAHACIKLGHIVDVYTMEWDAEFEPGLAIHVIPAKGWQNHTRRQHFIQQLQARLAQTAYDRVIGFNKMPGLDIYYAADTCYQAKARAQRGYIYRLTQRYRQTIALENAVFSPTVKTQILLIAALQQSEFMTYYHTQPNRFHLLPPGIARDRIAPSNCATIRTAIRKKHSIPATDFLLLMVGSGFKTKGLARSLDAFAALPQTILRRTQLFIIGKDNAKPFQRQAKQLKIHNRIRFLGGIDDVPNYLMAADLLLHPALNENTGTVLLEALASGLPVLTTDVCGYAHYINEAQAGIVLASPFNQHEFNKTLADMLLSPERNNWQQNALAFAKQADIFAMPERAVTLIETLR
jgi:UDP-glucose:(heptosyl)LPS alpha-1,3-glucosyltransferase